MTTNLVTPSEQEEIEKVRLRIGIRNHGLFFEIEEGVYLNLIEVSEDYLKTLGYPLLNKLLGFFHYKGDFLDPMTKVSYFEDHLDALFSFRFKEKEEDGVVPNGISVEEINRDVNLLHLRQYEEVNGELIAFKYSFIVEDYIELSFRDVVNAVIKLKRVVDAFANS